MDRRKQGRGKGSKKPSNSSSRNRERRVKGTTSELNSSELCVYCRERPGTEDEHAVGRLFFPPRRPHNMITVPGCTVCNGGISKDEEYTRAVLLTLADTENSPEAERIRYGELSRSFERAEGKRFAKGILASIEWVTLRTSAGLILPNKVPVIGADKERLDRVFIKIVKGLYYHHKRTRLPSDHEVLVYIPGIGEPLREFVPKMIRYVEERGVLYKIGDGSSFAYSLVECCRAKLIG